MNYKEMIRSSLLSIGCTEEETEEIYQDVKLLAHDMEIVGIGDAEKKLIKALMMKN